MKDWTWQKWLGKLTPVVVGLLTVGLWEFFEVPVPGWTAAVAGAITVLVQTAIALFPPKAEG